MRRPLAVPTSARNSNSCVAISLVPPWATNACAAPPPVRSSSNSKPPYRDGTTHLVMTPLEFLQRLAALVPRPRLHLIRFHGVLAPNAALRSQIVPGEVEPAPNTAEGNGAAPTPSSRARMSWAQLLKRVFAIDITTCPQCGTPLTILAAIEDPAVISKILTHLGLPTRAPPKALAHIDAFFQTA